MKTRRIRPRFALSRLASPRTTSLQVSLSCSLQVLAAVGLLASLVPLDGRAAPVVQGQQLPANTLPVLREVVSGATVTAAGAQLTVNQTAQRAIVNWNSFNIANGSEVKFVQPNATASALNRIWSADPSVIQGRLTANGQVILINQNGILFDRGAQINVGSLVASTLNMTDDRFKLGLTAGGLDTAAFEGGYGDASLVSGTNAQRGIIAMALNPATGTVNAVNGTTAAPQINAAAGGSIVLIANKVDINAGSLSAPDGQVLLAAGKSAYLALADDSTPGLRGMRVEITADKNTATEVNSLIRNAGVISADRGNVTLAALAINQEGRISASTAVQANGSIYLQSRDKAGALRGEVVFAAGSVTESAPDASDTATVAEATAFANSEAALDRRSLIQVEGGAIYSAGSIKSVGGRIKIDAQGDPSLANSDVALSTARVYLDSGSELSAAGNWADVDFSKNLLTFRVTSNELKDSPDQKTGVLKGATVTVDLRKDNPTLDLSGYKAALQRTVAEKTTVGGNIDITSTGDVIQRQGAAIDVSGGGYRYSDGTANTTKLLGADRKIYDIGSAPEAQAYTDILDHAVQKFDRWGQVTTYTNLMAGAASHEAAYVEGQAAGAMTIKSATGTVLDGALKGGVTVGPNQLNKAPLAGSLVVGSFNVSSNQLDGGLIGDIRFAQKATDTLGASFTASTALDTTLHPLTLAADQLFAPATALGPTSYQQNGLGSVELDSSGTVTLPAAVHIDGPAGSSLTLRGLHVDVAGDIALPSGSLTLQAITSSAAQAGDSPSAVVRGSADLSTAGLWINRDTLDGSFFGTPLASALSAPTADAPTATRSLTNGGSISVSALTGGSTVLETGSVLDVTGGGSIDKAGKLSLGDGGSIKLSTPLDTSMRSGWMNADLLGYAGGKGGSLSIGTPSAFMGAVGGVGANQLWVSPALFSDNGFGSLTISAWEDLTLAAGTLLVAKQKNWIVDNLAAAQLGTGGSLASIATTALLTDDLRKPVNVTWSAGLKSSGGDIVSSGSVAGTGKLVMGTGAAIVADPKASIALSARDGLTVDGSITAAGGSIALKLMAPAGLAQPVAVLELGSEAHLSTAGTFVERVDGDLLTQGSVIGGGAVTIEAVGVGLALDAGSSIDVSGASHRVDATVNGQVVSQRLDGDAGTVLLKSQGRTDLQGRLLGRAASGQSAGGSFALELTTPNGDDVHTKPDASRIIVSQNAANQAVEVGTSDAQLRIDALTSGGFQKLRLLADDSIRFDGNVNANFAQGIRLDTPLLDVTGNGRVQLAGSNVAIGQSRGPVMLTSNSYSRQSLAESLPVATRSGGGTLTAQGGTLDLYGDLTLNGVQQANLLADGDIRLSGRAVKPDNQLSRQQGSLTTTANVLMQSAQVYTTTAAQYTLSVKNQPTDSLVPGGQITLARNGQAPGDVYSAGSSLTLAADRITQGGVLKAPLGSLALNAGSQLDLQAGSLTSVSSDGLVIPYGTTLAGLQWQYSDGFDLAAKGITALTAGDKRLALSGTQVNVKAGATVDLSGGGDVQAKEFVQGSGGLKDTLVQPDTYAIIPKSRLSSMPVDADVTKQKDLGFGFGSATLDGVSYDSLHIGAGAGVPAGDYVLLPGRYALLPGAYLVQLKTGSAYSQLADGQTVQLGNGQTLVAGYRMVNGTGIRQSQTVGVLVRPGSAAFTESDYTLSGQQFFADTAARDRQAMPRLPVDAARLAISNVSSLALDGSFISTPATSGSGANALTGRSAQVDISGEHIAVVDRVGQAGIDSTFLQLEASGLSRLGGSLLLGGTRSDGADAVQIDTGAAEVLVANSAAHPLQLPEVLLAAKDSITVRSGSVIKGSGSAQVAADPLQQNDGGAFMRLANSGQAVFTRNNSPTPGDVGIEAGVVLQADKAMLIDATHSLRSQAALQVGGALGKGGALSLASSQVSLGETDGVAGIDTGLVLSNSTLASLSQLDAFTLKGYGGIDFFGAATLGGAGLGVLTLESPALRAAGTAAAVGITAKTVVLSNDTAGQAAAASAGNGSLAVSAGRIVLGEGDKTISGFATVATTASGEVVGDGTGSLAVAADWAIQAGRLTGTAGANQAWRAVDGGDPANPVYRALSIGASGGAALADNTALGARLRLEGAKVDLSTAVVAHSGRIDIAALGAGAADGVTLASGARLDASGLAKDFNGALAIANAGQVRLSAANGGVAVQGGAQVNVSAASQGGDAGSLAVSGTGFQLGGSLLATAGAAAQGGQFTLDAGNLADFGSLNQALNAGNFSELRDIRVRQGDLAVGAGNTVKAHHITLEADSGRIDIAGRLDASSAAGNGSVEAHAKNGLALSATAMVDASGTSTGSADSDALSHGGRVVLSAGDGALRFADGAVIDVRAGAKGDAGSVTFEVARGDNNQITVAPELQGRVLSQRHSGDAAGQVVLQAKRVYQYDAAVDGALPVAGYAGDHEAFVNATDASALMAGIKGDGSAAANTHLRGATEVRSNGDITVDAAWNLTDGQWLAKGEAGTLTLLAGGNLLISKALGMPDDNILAGDTWSLALVGGADLSAANALRTQTGAAALGNVTLSGSAAKVRTGTGRIDIAAAHDVVLDDPAAVIYTAGKKGVADAANTVATPNKPALVSDRWSVQGGDISITAGHDAIGSSSQLINDWLRRPKGNGALLAGLSDWWVYRPNFRSGVGALGGGNVRIAAGNDVNNLSAAVASNGRHDATTMLLDVQGGGNLRVDAGNNLLGGSYLVARGEGRISAGGDIGNSAATQLYLMGASNGAVPAHAGFALAAGGDIHLQSVDNPTAIALGSARGVSGLPSFPTGGTSVPTFYSYAPTDSVKLQAKGGDVDFGVNPDGNTGYAPVLDVTAFAGDIDGMDRTVVLYPSTQGQLRLLAAGSVGRLDLTVSDKALSTIPGVANPRVTGSSVLDASNDLAGNTSSRIVTHVGTAPYAYDIQALEGSIGGSTTSTVSLPGVSRLRAGLDITNVSLTLQNLQAGDVSQVRADEGDVRPFGGLDIRGPGQLLVQAGRNIDLGTAQVASGSGILGGLVASGNINNASLPSADSARVTLIAGYTGELDLSKLDTAYTQLIAAGKAQDKAAGQAAIDAVIDKTQVQPGNIYSFNTSIQTYGGSGIDLWAPGGDIVVGLTTPIDKATTIGTVTNSGGAIRSVLSGDFNINQGKVLTAQGGDVLIYSSEGNIDAGRGAQTSLSTPPPKRTPVYLTESDGVTPVKDAHGDPIIDSYLYTVQAAAAGSGIRTLTSDPDGVGPRVAPTAGSIYLFAPSGFIDAGEAGISSGGNLFLSALTVLNAANISSAGTSQGVPQVQSGSLASSMATSNSAPTGNKAAEDAADAAGKAARDAAAAVTAAPKPSILTVEVLGFGEGNCKEDKKDCLERAKP